MKRTLLFFIILSLSLFRAFAEDTLIVNGGIQEDYVLGGKYLEIFEDKSRGLTIKNILKDNIQKQFKINSESYAFNKNYSSAYWIKFTIRSESRDAIHYMLESYSLNTQIIHLYYEDDEGIIHEEVNGESVTYPERINQHKNLVFDLPIPENDPVRTFYVRVYSPLHSGFDYHVKPLRSFLHYSLNEYYLLGIYYGILLIMAIYNLIIFFTIKVKLHLYYVFYILSGILYSLNEDKLGFQYIWPKLYWLNPILAYHVSPLLLIATFILYGSEFLELRKKHRIFFYLTLVATGVYVVLFIINIFIPLGIALRIFFVVPFLVMYIAAFYSYITISGQSSSRLFVIGATFLLATVILIQLRSIGMMPGNIFTVYLLNYSLVIESVILSVSLSERIKNIQRDKEVAQQQVIEELEENKRLQTIVTQQLYEKQQLQEKVNRELEQKVQERTVELRMANEEIKRMNELLYADNVKLEINLKELSKARVMLKGVDFEEFSKIYPDEDSCYKFLCELKWKGEFKCKKCGHNNFCAGQTQYSRRCTKCRYDESPTAYTIFQGIKFPITKAFYILFLFYSSKEKLTSTEISRILFLRQKTCWSFIHKIMEVSKNKNASKKGKDDGWASLVLD